jgi:hypothetical protein
MLRGHFPNMEMLTKSITCAVLKAGPSFHVGILRKFLQFQISTNLTAVVIAFVTAVASNSETSVLSAAQFLWINIIMDSTFTSAGYPCPHALCAFALAEYVAENPEVSSLWRRYYPCLCQSQWDTFIHRK